MVKKQILVPLHKKLRVHAKRAVIPHAKNQYRPHLIRWGGLAIVIMLVFALQAGYNFSQSGSVLGQGSDVTSQQLLDETNRQRTERGLSPLTLNQNLAVGATMKANDMFLHNYWAHQSPNGTQPWHWFKKADYNYAYAGENLAKNFHTSLGVMAAWMNSPEHKKNILDKDYKNVGFAVVPGKLDGKDTMLVVAFYGAKQTGNPVATTANATLAANGTSGSLASRIGVGLQSITPAALTSVILLFFATFIAILAHTYRQKLPKKFRESWYRHHGLYKAIGMTSLIVVVIALYGGGQI